MIHRMSYSDIAQTSAFVAGRDAGRELRRDGVGWSADDGYRMCPRGMDPADEAAWVQGWRSAWA